MATVCGIHIDQRRFRLLALDGGLKKHRVVAAAGGEVGPEEDLVEVVSAELKQIARESKIKPDEVALIVDSSSAAFRSLKLPFDDRSKIEEVLKFEVESDLPQWDIDEVVVDFQVVDSKPGVESNLLVSAVPKARLADPLLACEKAGLEATDAELDAIALYNAAHHSGVLEAEQAELLVFVGDATTSVVVVDGGRLSAVRAIRAGARPPLDASAFDLGEDLDEEEFEERFEENRLERLRRSAQRIRREVSRTLSAARTKNPIQRILLSGDELPGLGSGSFGELHVERLEPHLPALEVEDREQYVAAYGAAIELLGGGGAHSHLRREDLRYTGKFERLELPLAVFSLLLAAVLGVNLLITNYQLAWRDEGDPARNAPGDLQIWMQASNAYLFPNPNSSPPHPGRLERPPESLLNYARRAERGEDADRTKFEELLQIRTQLRQEIQNVDKDLGQVTDFEPPQSSLRASSAVLAVMDGMGADLGRYAIRRLEANYAQGSGTRGDYVIVKLDLDFLDPSSAVASKHYNNLQAALESEAWCIEVEGKASNVIEGGKGISVDGFTVLVDMTPDEEDQA